MFFFLFLGALLASLTHPFVFLPSDSQIRTLAARAAASFVLANEGNTPLLKHFSDLLPGILQVTTLLPPPHPLTPQPLSQPPGLTGGSSSYPLSSRRAGKKESRFLYSESF